MAKKLINKIFRFRYIRNIILKCTMNVYVRFKPITKKIVNDDSNYIVSFTSYGHRIEKVWITAKTILLQKKFAPYKIILWLSHEDKKFVNDQILNLQKYGLEIRYCNDYKSYKKVLMTAKEFEDYKIITVDDDIMYPPKHLSKLVQLSEKHPECVCCYLAHRITKKNGKIEKYLDWINGSPGEKGPSNLLVPIGCNGILYPQNYFTDADLDYNNIVKIAPSNDDLWFKFIGLKKNIPTIKVSEDYVFVPNTPGTLYNGMFQDNRTKNDIAFDLLQRHFQIDVSKVAD